MADDDKVVTRYRATGTHEGGSLDVPATSKHGEMDGICIDRIREGKTVETWYTIDAYGYLKSLESIQ